MQLTDEDRARIAQGAGQVAQHIQRFAAALTAAAPVISETSRQRLERGGMFTGPDAFRCDGTGEPWTP